MKKVFISMVLYQAKQQLRECRFPWHQICQEQQKWTHCGQEGMPPTDPLYSFYHPFFLFSEEYKDLLAAKN